jgi:phosphoglycerate kinase
MWLRQMRFQMMETKIVNVDSIPDGWQGLDAGPKSLANFEIMESKNDTLEWTIRGFEMESFANGTVELGKYIAASLQKELSLVGGGDSGGSKAIRS